MAAVKRSGWRRFLPIREMDGKEDRPRGYGTIRTLWRAFFNHKTTIDYRRNNYELFKALYYASTNGQDIDESMLLGAGFAKPIVNSTVAFALGSGFTVKLDGADAEGADALKAVQDDLQGWVQDNFDQIYDWAKFGNRDGDGYLFIDELGKLSQLKPDTVQVVVNAVSGELLGYNVTETVKVTEPNTGRERTVEYLKQYRRNFVRITKIEENQSQADGQIMYERVFANGEAIDTQLKDENDNPLDLELLADEIDERMLPIVHFRNEPEPGALYGNSELQNVLVFMRNYGEVLDEATKANVYNSKPVLVIKGVASPEDDAANKDAYKDNPITGEKELDWQQNTTLYIEDPQGDAKFLEIPNTMDNTGKLLEYLFYCIVQASETPEFVFGTAIASSQASVSEQMPIVVMKAERKRKQMRRTLMELIQLHITRQIELANPVYFALRDVEPSLDIDFPPIVDEDKQLNLQTVQALLSAGILSDTTALEQLMQMSGEEAKAEITKALNDAKARTDANSTTDRLTNELGAGNTQ